MPETPEVAIAKVWPVLTQPSHVTVLSRANLETMLAQSIEEVGNVAAFLLSDLASGVTAEITYVDGGFSNTIVPDADGN